MPGVSVVVTMHYVSGVAFVVFVTRYHGKLEMGCSRGID